MGGRDRRLWLRSGSASGKWDLAGIVPARHDHESQSPLLLASVIAREHRGGPVGLLCPQDLLNHHIIRIWSSLSFIPHKGMSLCPLFQNN